MSPFHRFIYDQRHILILWVLETVLFLLYLIPNIPYVQDWLYPVILNFILLLLYLAYAYRKYKKQEEDIEIFQRIHDHSLSWNKRDELWMQTVQDIGQEAGDEITKMQDSWNELEDMMLLWIHQAKLPLSVLHLMAEEETVDQKELKSQIFRLEQYNKMALVCTKMADTQTDFVFEDVEIEEMIREVIRNFSGEFIRRRIALDFDISKGSIITDKKWFSFAVEQILSNALKYARHQIRIYLKDDVLHIEDDGIGIEPRELERILQKGYTGINGHQKSESSGLGLYLTQKVLYQLNHPFQIKSIPNQKTDVQILLLPDRPQYIE